VFGGSINATFQPEQLDPEQHRVREVHAEPVHGVPGLQGYTPTQASSITAQVPTSRTREMGEMEYNNLPTYVRSVTYGAC